MLRNKKVGIVSITLVLVIMLTLVAGCIEKEETPITPMTITITDSTGREVRITKPVERIVFTHYSTAEAIKVIGAWDKVVGRGEYAKDKVAFPGVEELPVIGGWASPYDVNYEEVFELQADIFLTAMVPSYAGLEDLIAKLEPDIPVVALNFFEPETLVENMRKLGDILDKEEEAEKFIAFYLEVENQIKERLVGLSEDKKPLVLFKAPGITPEELWILTDETPAIRYQIGLAGGINVAADLPGGWVEVDPEWVIMQNPDILVALIWKDFAPDAFGFEVDDSSVAKGMRDEIMNMDVFAGSKAVKEKKVYLYDSKLMSTLRFVAGTAYLAKWFHPELCQELDPQAIYQEYLTRFLRIDYDLDKHGVFVYPEP